MKIAAIADTHGQHRKLNVPEADGIIHAGDVVGRSTLEQTLDFLNWFSSLPHKYKIFIAGNHDFLFEKTDKYSLNKIIPKNIIYLNDQLVEIEGVKIWGSPITPWFYDWAFNRSRGADIQKHWDMIPKGIDILLTHGPVYGRRDMVLSGKNVGCENLLATVKKIKPKFHVCGHIHEGYGISEFEPTTFINASVVDENYILRNDPIIFEI